MDLLAAYSSGSDDDGEEDLDAHESACFSEHIKEPSGASGREGSAFTLNREPLQAKVITASTANQGEYINILMSECLQHTWVHQLFLEFPAGGYVDQ